MASYAVEVVQHVRRRVVVEASSGREARQRAKDPANWTDDSDLDTAEEWATVRSLRVAPEFGAKGEPGTGADQAAEGTA